MRKLEDENGKLRKIVADLTVDCELSQDVIRRREDSQAKRGQRSEAGSEA